MTRSVKQPPPFNQSQPLLGRISCSLAVDKYVFKLDRGISAGEGRILRLDAYVLESHVADLVVGVSGDSAETLALYIYVFY